LKAPGKTMPRKSARGQRLRPITDPKAITARALLHKQAQQDLLRFITCGSVDDGKSTLLGRLLWETQHVFDDQLNTLLADSKRFGSQGTDIDFALLIDGLIAEREQKITIDVAYRYFSTPRRKFIVADTPGHEQYTRNMITGASTADAAVLLVDAQKGILNQSRRHAYLMSLLGIRQVILAVNKMDLVAYDQAVFNSLVTEFDDLAKSLKFEDIRSIPLSALQGDNIVSRSSQTVWYDGPTLLESLETLNNFNKINQNEVVFPVQWVNRPNADFRGFSGTLAAGQLALGDQLQIAASGETAKLARIVTADGDLISARAGDAITLVLDREVDASRGDVIASANNSLKFSDQFQASLVWMDSEPGYIGRTYDLKLANQWSSASITRLKYTVEVSNQTQERCDRLALNDIAVVNLALSRAISFSPYDENPALGGFILVDRFSHATVAAGMIQQDLSHSDNVRIETLSINRAAREQLNSHKSKVVWFTGLSGAGKSTIANALEKTLHSQGKRTYVLDGDNIRKGLNKDLGFSDADRVENIRRVAEVAKLMMDAGLIVLTAFISPFRAEREMARELIGKENFVEVFVDTPLEVCERRDPKGLYKKARSGSVPNMTGIDSPYEPPLCPDVILTMDGRSLEETAVSISKML
jgi:bifunctional enzyme CysN/CysC